MMMGITGSRYSRSLTIRLYLQSIRYQLTMIEAEGEPIPPEVIGWVDAKIKERKDEQ